MLNYFLVGNEKLSRFQDYSNQFPEQYSYIINVLFRDKKLYKSIDKSTKTILFNILANLKERDNRYQMTLEYNDSLVSKNYKIEKENEKKLESLKRPKKDDGKKRYKKHTPESKKNKFIEMKKRMIKPLLKKRVVPNKTLFVYLSSAMYTKEILSKNEILNDVMNTHGFSYTSLKKAISILESMNMIKIEKGGRKFFIPGFDDYEEKPSNIKYSIRRNKAYAYEDTISEIELLPMKDWNIDYSSFEEGILFLSAFQSLSFREKTDIQKSKKDYGCFVVDKLHDLDGNLLPLNNHKKKIEKADEYSVSPAPFLYKNRLKRINSNLPNFSHYQRGFINSVDFGGRFYSPMSFIKNEAIEPLLNKFNIEKLDFSSFGPNCLYLLTTGEKYKGDMYLDVIRNINAIPQKLQKFYRPIMKKMMSSHFGNNGKSNSCQSIRTMLIDSGLYYSEKFLKDFDPRYFHEGKWFEPRKDEKIKQKKYLEENGFKEEINLIPLTIDEVISSFEKVHSKIKIFFHHDISIKIQNIESEIAEEIMIDMKNDGLFPFSRHDAFYVPKSLVKKYEKKMEEYLVRVCKKYSFSFENENSPIPPLCIFKIKNSSSNFIKNVGKKLFYKLSYVNKNNKYMYSIFRLFNNTDKMFSGIIIRTIIPAPYTG